MESIDANNKKADKNEKTWIIPTILLIITLLASGYLFTQYRSLQFEVASLKVTIVNKESEINYLESTVESLGSDIKTLESIVTIRDAEITSLKFEVDRKDRRINSLLNQMDTLRQTAEENKFNFYYASRAEQRYGVYDLQEYLDRWQWIEGSYTEHVFDCSEMSAYLEWRLENEGYHTYIVCGEAPWGDGYHAWLLVETSEEGYMPVETTSYDMITWYEPYFNNYFEYDEIFETIEEALEGSYPEFNWWES